jgi:single-strand DNA-binding protein
MYDLRPRTSFTGRLTRDSELRSLPSGSNVCELRIAFDQRAEKQPTGYFDVCVYGTYADTCASLTKGQLVGVHGRIEYREWEASDGSRRSAHRVIADEVTFLSPKPEGATETAEPEAIAA